MDHNNLNPARSRYTRAQLITAALLAVFILFAAFMIFVYPRLVTAYVTIESEEGSTISVALVRDTPFEEIGTRKATYATREEGTLYIQVTKEGRQTITSAELETGSSKDVKVALNQVEAANVEAETTLSHFHFEGNFVYGINPNTQAVTYRRLGEEFLSDVSYNQLPRTEEVVWRDRNNFIFRASSQGIGTFIDGRIGALPFEGLVDDVFIADFAASPGLRDLLVNTSSALYLGDAGLETQSFKKLFDFESEFDFNQLFTDGRYVYAASATYAPGADGDFGDEGSLDTQKITVVGFDGATIATFELEGASEIQKIARIGESSNYAILTDQQLLVHDTDAQATSFVNLYFGNLQDILIVDDQLLVLSREGLWRLADESLYLLVAPPNADAQMTAGSLRADNDGSVLFSSMVRPEKALSSEDQLVNTIMRYRAP